MNVVSRRTLLAAAGSVALAPTAWSRAAEPAPPFAWRWILASPMYGTAPLAEVLAEAPKIAAGHIDIWPRPHANHREQMDELGLDRVRQLLAQHAVRLGMLTRYDLGPFRLADDMRLLAEFQGEVIVCGATRRAGDDLKTEVRSLLDQLRPTIALAEQLGVVVGIENHSNTLLAEVDAIRWFGELSPSEHLGVALAPYHLPQQPEAIAALIRDLGPKLVHFQGWQHGHGCQEKLPKEEELLQLPGRGELDFTPLVAALRAIDYAGFTEIFMHPVPRGVPILDTTPAVTTEINRAREYLERCLAAATG